MRGGVVAGEGVLGEQQADRRYVERVGPAGVVDELGEDERRRLVVVGDEGQGADDHGDTAQVPPDADGVEHADEADPEEVERGVQQQDAQEDQERRAGSGHEPEAEVEEGAGEQGRAVVDAGDGAEQAEQVQPARVPAPAASAEPVGHVVERTGGGVGAGHLGQGETHAEHEEAYADPAPQHHRRAAGAHAEAVQRHAAGEDGYDGEADGEVAEAAHPAGEDGLVAEFPEALFLVLLGWSLAVLAGCPIGSGHGGTSGGL